MQPILIQGAMDIEIKHLIEFFSAKIDKEIGGFSFFKGFFGEIPVIISKTDIGVANASASTAIGILNYQPKFIINQGTAGAHNINLHTLDIVIGKYCKNINSFEKPYLDIKKGIDYNNWINTNFSEYDEKTSEILVNQKLVDIFEEINYEDGKKIIGTLGSADVWNKEIDFINWLNKTLKTDCEDMESIGVYTVANGFNVPVIGVRIISNNEILKEEYNRKSAFYLQKFITDNFAKISAN